MGATGPCRSDADGQRPAADLCGQSLSARSEGPETAICDRCLKPIEDAEAHGLYKCPYEPRGNTNSRYFQDHVPGGFWIENMTARPLFFESKSEHRKKMKDLGLVPKVRHVDGDKHVKRWI